MSVSTKDAYSQMFAKNPDVVSVTQLGQMLHISERLAYRLIRENQIACLKIGRTYKIPKINVIKYLGIIDQFCLIFRVGKGRRIRAQNPKNRW